jgi:hypothetical protein
MARTFIRYWRTPRGVCARKNPKSSPPQTVIIADVVVLVNIIVRGIFLLNFFTNVLAISDNSEHISFFSKKIIAPRKVGGGGGAKFSLSPFSIYFHPNNCTQASFVRYIYTRRRMVQKSHGLIITEKDFGKPNTNMNIFGDKFLTEYEYIWRSIFNQIRI